MLTNRLTGTTETNGGLRNEHHDSPPRTQPHPTAESSAIPIRARSRGPLLTRRNTQVRSGRLCACATYAQNGLWRWPRILRSISRHVRSDGGHLHSSSFAQTFTRQRLSLADPTRSARPSSCGPSLATSAGTTAVVMAHPGHSTPPWLCTTSTGSMGHTGVWRASSPKWQRAHWNHDALGTSSRSPARTAAVGSTRASPPPPSLRPRRR